ncbi:MAG TPA: hypothetical protein VNC78_09030 [Actinomycetota bacterium]|nr:hypothetical protein [Actinomycetota bacterium]
MRVKRLLALFLAMLVMVGPGAPSALAAQADAREDPAVSGPLTLSGKDCRTSKEETEAGEVAGRARICLFIYAFDPAEEDDLTLDYGIVWAQSNVDASLGWCSKKAQTDIIVPHTMPIYHRAPEAGTITEARDVTVTLEADADGNSPSEGSVSKDVTIFPDELTRSRRPVDAPEENAPAADQADAQDVVRLTWVGSQSKKLAFATGFETSWPQGENPPPISFSVRYPLKQTSC